MPSGAAHGRARRAAPLRQAACSARALGLPRPSPAPPHAAGDPHAAWIVRAQLDKEQEKGAKKEEKLVAQMEAAKAKAAKAKPSASKPAAKPPKGKGTKKEPVIVEDEDHYVKWTKKVLGAKGEKADEEMLAVLDAKGPAGLVKLLTKRYKADQK